jgi:hypothetical protein
MAFWYGGGNRTAYNTFAAFLSRDLIDPTTFPLPYDPALKRIIPAAMGPRPGSEGVPACDNVGQLAVPPDLLVRDWQLFMGKTLNRGFDTPAAIARALELLTTLFARHVPPASIVSAQGVYTSCLGDHAAALGLHKQAVQIDSANPLFLKRLGATMLAMDPDDVMGRIMLERATDLAPQQALYRATLADCLYTQGDKGAGFAMMKTAAWAEYTTPEVAFIAARMKRQIKQCDAEALALIDHALAGAPHIRRFMMMRMYIQAEGGDLPAALQTADDITARYGEAGDLNAWRARNPT